MKMYLFLDSFAMKKKNSKYLSICAPIVIQPNKNVKCAI